MTDRTVHGALQWIPEQNRLVARGDDGKRYNVNKPDRDLHPQLHEHEPSTLHGTAVEFRVHNSQPRDIRPLGVAVVKQKRRRRSHPDAFHNPYSFVPAPPRDNYPEGLGNAPGPGHHALQNKLWSGRIHVKLTVRTPLLVLDTTRAVTDPDSKHQTFAVLRRPDPTGTPVPHIPTTAMKGMLRTAYEAVTNSRTGVFVGHDERLGMRMSAHDAQRMVPARISNNGQHVVLMPGDTPPGQQTATNPLLHAAWLPTYPVSYVTAGGYRPTHGDEVDAVVEMFQHHRWHTKKNTYVTDCRLWRVRAIAPPGTRLPPVAPTSPPAPGGRSWYEPVAGQPLRHIRGWVMLTGRNINGKHDERVFFIGQVAPQKVPLDSLRDQWREVIEDYRAVHRDAEIFDRRHNGAPVRPDQWIGPEPGRTAWSPHLWDDNRTKLQPGQLCYAYSQGGKPIGLYPVTIARRLHEDAPANRLPPSVRPAKTLTEMSPADRVFGWVHDDGAGAYRGHLRIGPVTCLTDDAVTDDETSFGADGLPLAILSQPKPHQGRFYAAQNSDTPEIPLADRLARDKWYTPGRGLRGRKMYRHHAGLPDGYWHQPVNDRTQVPDEGRYQEYRRPRDADGREQRDDQNRSIRGWIRAGAEFEFTLDVSNLSDIELGAMLWLLRLPDGHFHRFGLGKPLGFGSVRLDLDAARSILCRGDAWARYYADLADIDGPDGCGEDEMVRLADGFATAMPHRETVLSAFLALASGDPDTPVHYPRVRPGDMAEDVPVPPDPRGRSFAWFVENERVEQREIIHGQALPPAGGPALTVYEETKASGRTSER